jgi:hypothetical protein
METLTTISISSLYSEHKFSPIEKSRIIYEAHEGQGFFLSNFNSSHAYILASIRCTAAGSAQ